MSPMAISLALNPGSKTSSENIIKNRTNIIDNILGVHVPSELTLLIYIHMLSGVLHKNPELVEEWLPLLSTFRTRDYYNAIMDLYKELEQIYTNKFLCLDNV